MPSASSKSSKVTRSPRAARVPDKVMHHLLSSPWAISESGLNRVLAIASRLTISPEALSERHDKPLDNTRSVTVRDRIATIDVSGPLLKRAGWINAISGAADYGSIAADLRSALDERSIEAIVLNLDSPGGEVNGCSELAQLIRAGRELKPIYAYVDGECCSAAYWLASACTAIYVSDTALVGNLGVRVTLLNDEKKLRAEGIERVTIVSSQTPAKPYDANTDPARARVEKLVDSLASVFFAGVAEGRGVDVDTVAKEYGAGAVFVGAEAVAGGLADELTTYEALVASLIAAHNGASSPQQETAMPPLKKGRADGMRAAPKSKTPSLRPKGEDTTREKEMDGKEASADDGEDGTMPGQCAECDTELPEGAKFCPECGAPVGDGEAAGEGDVPAGDPPKDKPKDETPSAVRTAAATAERARIVGILGYAARFGLEAVMPMITDASCSKEGAAAKLLELAPATSARRLGALRADEVSVANAPKKEGAAAIPGATAGTNRLLASLARTNPAALPDSAKAGSSK